MSIADFITPALAGIAGSLAMGYLYRQAGERLPPSKGSKRTLRVPQLYAYVGWIGVAIAVIPIGIVLYDLGSHDASTFVSVGFIFLLMGGLGGACLVSYYRLALTYDPDRIRVIGVWGPPREFGWNDIERVGSSAMSGYVHLWVGGEKVRVSGHLVGLRSFIDALAAHTSFGHEDIDLPI